MIREHGYLMVDHRASPGIPEDVARQVGYDPRLCQEGKLFEVSTLTCSHCKNVVVKNPFRTRERHNCMKCGGHYICDGCAFEATLPDYLHTPFDKVIDETLRVAASGSPPTLLMPTPNEGL